MDRTRRIPTLVSDGTNGIISGCTNWQPPRPAKSSATSPIDLYEVMAFSEDGQFAQGPEEQKPNNLNVVARTAGCDPPVWFCNEAPAW
jgi:hypothetical protein